MQIANDSGIRHFKKMMLSVIIKRTFVPGGFPIKYIDEIFKAIDLLNVDSKYVPREGQENLMLDIGEAMQGEAVLMAEAGVGIGKSFAYLIPGLIRSKRLKKPLIVSSSSIQLTEQLVGDIEAVSQILSTNFTYVVGKGRTNYLCYARYKSGNKHKDLTDILTLQEEWKTGFIKPMEKKKWCVDNCLFNQCEYRNSCDFYNMRQNLKPRYTSSVDCIIVNHNLLVEDLKKKVKLHQPGLIQEGHSIVLDEAHKFEDIVRDAFNIKINIKMVKRMERAIKDLEFDLGLNLKTMRLLTEFLEDFNRELIKIYATEGKYILGNRLDIKELMSMKFKDMNLLLAKFNTMKSELRYLDFKDSKEKVYDELDEMIGTIIDYFESIGPEVSVYWAIYEKIFDVNGLALCSAPKEINKIIYELLFENQKSIILTSATLGGNVPINSAINQNRAYYEYQTQALGLPKSTIYSAPQKSPYNYEENTLVYLPSMDIDVREDSMSNDIANEIIQLANIMDGRTLILFTSKKQMESVYGEMLLRKDTFTWKLLKQEDNGSVNRLREEFSSQKAVLLSTGAFWEGINIKGPELSCLIVVKLPYPVPDPVIKYKASTNPSVHEAEMMIKLKQGTGRLIRSEMDLGIIAILDHRIKTKKYILQSLPFRNVTEEISVVKGFVENKMAQYLSEQR